MYFPQVGEDCQIENRKSWSDLRMFGTRQKRTGLIESSMLKQFGSAGPGGVYAAIVRASAELLGVFITQLYMASLREEKVSD